MPLKTAGVKFTAKDVDKFLKDLKRVENAYKSLGKSVNVGAGLGGADKAFGDLGGVVKNVGKNTAAVANSFTGILGLVVKLGTALYVLKRAWEAIIDTIKRFIGTAVNAAAELQVLTIRITNLSARQLRATDSTLTFEDSLAKVTPLVQDVLKWMKELANATPFSIESVSRTYSLVIAMGWVDKAARELTTKMLDFVAGTGLGNEVIERMVYNFAQLRTAQKLTGTEARDLARGAFLEIAAILRQVRDNIGDSTGSLRQLQEQMATGQISIDEFFKAFNDWVGKEFPDAARKMNFTVTALKDNLGDLFKTFIGWNVLGPVVDNAARRMTESLDRLVNDPQTEINTRLLGIALNDLFNIIVSSAGKVKAALTAVFKAMGLGPPSIEMVIKAIVLLELAFQGLANFISGFVTNIIAPFLEFRHQFQSVFFQLAVDAFKWGANIVFQLAQGIVKAAAAVITKAINFIAGIITNLLQGGSPPKILPQLTEWGSNAINEFLRGFKEIDYSILDSVQSSLQSSLQALVDLGEITKNDLSKIFLDVSTDLIAAIDNFNSTGQISTAIFDKLRAVGGGFGDELARLLKDQLELSKATKLVEFWQKKLNIAQQQTAAHRKNVSKLTKEYNALLRAGASQEELQAKLAELNKEELALQAAEENKKNAELRVEAAEAQLDPLKEAVKLQEQLIKQLVELARAQADANKAAEDGAGAGEGAEPEEPPEPPIPELELPDIGGGTGIDFDKMFQEIKDKFIGQLNTMWENIKAIAGQKWQLIVDRLKEIWDNFATKLGLPTWDEIAAVWADFDGSWASFLENLGETWDLFAARLSLPTVEEITAVWADFNGTFQSFVQNLIETWDLFAEKLGLPQSNEISSKFSETFANIKRTIEEAIGPVVDWITGVFVPGVIEAWDDLSRWWEVTWGRISDFWNRTVGPVFEAIFNILGKGFSAVFEVVKPAVEGLIKGLGRFVKAIGKLLASIDWGQVGKALLAVAGVIGVVLGGILTVAQAIFAGIVNAISTAVNFVVPLLEMIFEGIATFINGIADIIVGIFDIIVGIFSGNLDKIWRGVKEVFLGIIEVIFGFAESFLGIITGLITLVISLIGGFIDGIVDFFKSLVDLLIGNSIIPDLVDGIIEFFTNMVNTVVQIVGDFVQGIIDKAIELKDKFIEKVDLLRDKAIEIWENIRATVNEKMEAVRAWIQEKIDAIKAKWDEIWDAVKQKAIDIWDSIYTTVKTKVDEVKNWIETKIDEAKTTWETTWDAIKTKVEEIMGSIISAISTKTQEVYDTFIKPITDLVADLPGYVTNFFNIGVDLLQGLVDGIASIVSSVIETATGIVEGIINAVTGKAEAKSPSKVFARIGKDLMLGLQEGIEDASGDSEESAVTVVERMIMLAEMLRDVWGDAVTSVAHSVVKISDATFDALNLLAQRIVILTQTIANSWQRMINQMIAMSSQFTMEHARNMEMVRVYSDRAAMSNVAYQRNVTFGDTHIYNQMDDALFRQKVLRVIADL